jgi:hypothetical protein
MVSMLVSGVVDRGFDPGRVKIKTTICVWVASPLSTHHSGIRTKTGLL